MMIEAQSMISTLESSEFLVKKADSQASSQTYWSRLSGVQWNSGVTYFVWESLKCAKLPLFSLMETISYYINVK